MKDKRDQLIAIRSQMEFIYEMSKEGANKKLETVGEVISYLNNKFTELDKRAAEIKKELGL